MLKVRRPQNMDLSKLTDEEWESLCGHCGICCLHKILDMETGDIYTTRVVCKYYDLSCDKCSVYANRLQINPNCSKLNVTNISKLSWLPNSCNYRRALEGRPLLKSTTRVPAPWKNRLEQMLGCEVVSYQKGMDLTQYVVSWQYACDRGRQKKSG